MTKLEDVRYKLAMGNRLDNDDYLLLLGALLEQRLSQSESQHILIALDDAKLREALKDFLISRTETKNLPEPHITWLRKTREFIENNVDLKYSYSITQRGLANLLKDWSTVIESLSKFDKLGNRANARRERLARNLARLMSLNDKFQNNLQVVRQKWKITPQFPRYQEVLRVIPEDIILKHLSESQSKRSNDIGTQIRQFYELQKDIKSQLCDPFPRLNWRIHYGLIVSSLFFDFQPEHIAEDEDWKIIWQVARYVTSAKDIEVLNDLTPKLMGAMLTIRYFSQNANLDDLPQEIQAWVDFARDGFESLAISNEVNIPFVIKSIYGLPDSDPAGEPAILVRIHPDTIENDVRNLWPLARLRQIELWSKPPFNRLSGWATFAKDAVLLQLKSKYRHYEDVIQEYNQAYPDTPIATIKPYTDYVKKKVKSIRKRVIKL